MGEFRAAERAASIPLGYVFTLGIVAVLFSGLLVAGSGVLDSQTETTVEGELEVIGQEVARDLASADRLARAGDTTELSVRTELPQRTASAEYRLTVDGTSDEIRLETSDPEVTVTVPFRTELDVGGSVQGGDIRIVYDESADELEVVSA